jgi:DNA repair protein RecN (Recombination protein N)
VGKNKISRATLDEIAIRGLGVIDSASISFSPGFTAITGETGAGKTMVLTALGLITGAKADADFVRTNSERSTVSAQFTVHQNFVEKVLDAGGEVDGATLTISRSVSAEGKSRITLGGTLSTVAKVHELSTELIEIHAQSSSVRLSKSGVQRDLLDSYSELNKELVAYGSSYTQYCALADRIAKLKKESATSEKEITHLKAFIEDFAKLMPRTGELVEIENEINRLGSVEQIHSQLSLALNILDNDESGTLDSLKTAKKTLDQLLQKDSALDVHIEKFGDLIYSMEDVSAELVSYLVRLEADPARFEYLQQRKQGINALIKKYGIGTERDSAYEEMIANYDQAQLRIEDLSGGTDRITQLEAELLTHFTQMKTLALELHRKRVSYAVELSKAITAELSALSMPNAQVLVEVSALDDQDVRSYSPSGIDEVIFLFAPHTGSKLMPLSKIASGGEMSRLMLAIEVVIAAQSPVGTYVFDEVDAGVGGKAAVEVGRRLASLAKTSQVIVVTHLPQVAVWADNHLVVRKDQSGSITESSVLSLDKNERLREIARMLSGQEDSATAQKHAEELLQLVMDAQ